jgi:hypothetical protein
MQSFKLPRAIYVRLRCFGRLVFFSEIKLIHKIFTVSKAALRLRDVPYQPKLRNKNYFEDKTNSMENVI